MIDYAGNNTSKAAQAKGWRFIKTLALLVLGFSLFTMMLWSV